MSTKECYRTLIELADKKTVELFWIPGHEGVGGNKEADVDAKLRAATTLIG